MKAQREIAVGDEASDLSLPGGCILCDGDLAVRVTPSGMAGYCRRCRWISRPHVRREDGSVHVFHRPGGIA